MCVRACGTCVLKFVCTRACCGVDFQLNNFKSVCVCLSMRNCACPCVTVAVHSCDLLMVYFTGYVSLISQLPSGHTYSINKDSRLFWVTCTHTHTHTNTRIHGCVHTQTVQRKRLIEENQFPGIVALCSLALS